MIVKIENQKIVQRDVNLSKEFPNVSFPVKIEKQHLPPNYYIIESDNRPNVNWDEIAVQTDDVEFINDQIKIIWVITKISESEKQSIIQSKKSNLITTLESIRKFKEYREGIEYNSYKFSTSETSQTKIIGVSLLASQNTEFSVNWKTMTGEYVTLNSSDILSIISILRNHLQSCFDWEQQVIQQIKQMNTYEDIIALENSFKTMPKYNEERYVLSPIQRNRLF